MSPIKKHSITLILLVLVSILIFSNTFKNSFIWDDEDLILENRYIKSVKNIPFLFTPKYWNYYHPGTKGQYRPVRTVSFALDYSLWRANTFGYHLTNLLLHILNVILVYLLVYRLAGPNGSGGWLLKIPFLAALFFATHPVHIESVTWIKNRSDLFASLFFLSSILLFIRYILEKGKGPRIIYYSAVFCFILALFSKEMALSLPFVLVLYIICFLSKERYKEAIIKTLPFFGVMALYLIFKVTSLGMLASAENVSTNMNLYSNILTVFKTVGYYFLLLIFPFNLNAERYLAIPGSLIEPAVFLSLLLILFLSIIIVKTFFNKKYSKVLPFAILWILLTLIPASNIIFLSGRPIAEQRLYIPSVGFCLLLAMGVMRLPLRKLAILFSILLVILYSSTTIRRNLDWGNSITFWSKAVESSPRSSRAYNNLGNAYYETGKKTEAMPLYKRALELNPNYPDAQYNLGNAYYDIGKNEEAIALYKKAIMINTEFADAYNNLGIIYYEMGRGKDAIALYKKAIEINPYYVKAYNNLGNAYCDAGKNTEAIALYEKAVRITPDYAEAYNNLGSAYHDIGKYGKAALFYKKAIEINPDYADAYSNLAIAYYKEGKYALAIKNCDRAVELGTRVNPRFLELLKAYRQD